MHYIYIYRYIESASNKSRAIWKIINKESGKMRDDDYEIQLTIGKELVPNQTDITEKLNEFFTNTVVELVKQNTKKGSDTNLHQEVKYCPKSIFILPTTEHEVVNLAKTLKGKQSAGYDDIPGRIVKQCTHVIKKPLTHIYNTSFMTCVFPDKWKSAKVKPLYKKEEKQNIKNYRPISILSVFSKILKKLMFNRITAFLDDTKSLTGAQNGFRKGKCIETVIQSFIEHTQETLDKRTQATGIFIDLSKAYDN